MQNLDQTLAKLCPEDKLLLLVTSPCFDNTSKEKIFALINQGISWDYLLNRIYRNKLTPLFYSRLNAEFPELIPEEIRNGLKQVGSRVAMNNLHMTSNLVKLLNKFREAGITAVPFKGPLLASLAYGNVALRIFSDLDIYVQAKDIAAANKVLLDNGFKASFDSTNLANSIFIESAKECTYFNPTTKAGVDLHWKINYIFNATSLADTSFDQIINVSMNGFDIPSFSLEKLFFILNLHIATHCWESLFWLCDIAAFLKKNNNLNWQLIIDKAKELRVVKILSINFLLMNKLWGMPIPDAILKSFFAKPVAAGFSLSQSYLKFTNKIINNLFFKGDHQVSIWKAVFTFIPQIRDNFIDGYKDLFHFLLTPKTSDLTLFPLPKKLFFIYPIIRPFLMATRRYKERKKSSQMGSIRIFVDKIRRHLLERIDQVWAVALRRLSPKRAIVQFDGNPRIALLTVNFSTTRYLKLMLLTLAEQDRLDLLSQVIICDNGSTDDAQEFLAALDKQVNKIKVVHNTYLHSHANGMRLALKTLSRCENKVLPANILLFSDTDVIFLNPNTLQSLASTFVNNNIAFAGELRRGIYKYPEAQASFLAVRRDWYERSDIAPWVNHGAPAYWLQRSIWRNGGLGFDFPSNKDGYILHRGHSGIAAAAIHHRVNPYASVQNNQPHFMGIPNGARIWSTVEAKYADMLDLKDSGLIINELVRVFGSKNSSTYKA